MDVVRRAWEGGQLAQDLQCGYLRDRRLFEEGDGGYGRQRGWTSEHQRPKISAWDRTEPHTKTDKTLEQQSYSSLKDTGFCLVSGRTALPSRQGEWSTCVYTCTIKKKKQNTTNIRRLDFIRHSQKPWDCQERAVEGKETREKRQAHQEHPHSEGDGHLQCLVTH